MPSRVTPISTKLVKPMDWITATSNAENNHHCLRYSRIVNLIGALGLSCPTTRLVVLSAPVSEFN